MRQALSLFWLVLVAAALLWGSWFFRYEPVDGLLVLDRWSGELVVAGESERIAISRPGPSRDQK